MSDPMAEALLATWFGPDLEERAQAEARNKLWFQSTAAFDAELRARFGTLPARLRAGEFSSWKPTPRTALAGVIALDQIPRNIHRGSPDAFAYDADALAFAVHAIANGHDLVLHPLQAVFLYLPFEHAEDAAMQARSIELFTRLRERAPAELVDLFDGYLDYAHRHADVVARFGRFPHRNEILGRTPTPDETAYLAGGGQRF